MELLYTLGAILVPLYGIWFLQKRIQISDSKVWQSYAAFTALTLMASLCLLVASGKVVGVDSSGRVDFVRVTADQVRSIAKTIAELSANQQEPRIEHPARTLARYKEIRAKAERLLKQAGVSDGEITESLAPLDKLIVIWIEETKKASP